MSAKCEEIPKLIEERDASRRNLEKIERTLAENVKEIEKKNAQVNELTNETLSLRNSLNKARNQADLFENQQKLRAAEQEAAVRSRVHELELESSEKHRREMEVLKQDCEKSIEKLAKSKETVEEELYKVIFRGFSQNKGFS